ncbi:AIPR family protein [Duganella sp. sic0402]|uniref:AIPR family protein n=1 Tax=Duganella sp. sic0402 TaxID=2854786 RepID=UPI001C491F58|nr:AIPR family protein [Duganella sp. sic0402]MBV7539076.1 AIPR family protein [Duganella sp. sic0402]
MSYETLIKTLDALRSEAPKSFKSYYPKADDLEKINQARAIAFIHLFLKVRFGLIDFSKRHDHICDGSQDGGIDAYHIDSDSKKVTLIQSKFRATEKNFEGKSIEVSELLKMEVGRVSKGEKTDSNGVSFSARIIEFQKKIADIRDIATYTWQVVILANLKGVNDEQMRRLLDNMEYEVFDFPRTYSELVFPLTTGTSFAPNEITIKINLGKKQQPQLNQDVETSLGICNVRMLYVPTIEIARCMAKYRNALLRYNPRNYLSLSGNDVNKSIKDTIKNTTKNEFSLRNNGITLLVQYSSVTDRTGVTGEGQLIVKDPQILNGGQTATTLAMMIEDSEVGIAAFEGKEVLLKIIERPSDKSEEELAAFIETISDATNKQSKIVEADRRSNDPRLIKLQKYFYEEHGLFLERKRGEFKYGIDEKILSKSDIVDRVSMARALTAYTGSPARARSSQDRIFDEEGFDALLDNIDNINVSLAYFAMLALDSEDVIEKSSLPSHSFRYGKYAMLFAISKISILKDESAQIKENAKKLAISVVEKWKNFEKSVESKENNVKYKSDETFNFDGYYKGSTVDDDIKSFKWN